MTGAASGIGLAIARRLVDDGASVLAVDLTVGDHVPGHPLTADLATRAGNRAAVDEALARLGRLDGVVACAGVQKVHPIDAFPEDDWDRLIAVLLTSPFLLARYAWPALTRSGSGRFIAVSSVHGLVASPYKAAYVSAKHGLLGLVKSLALEGAAVGIAATAVCPGVVSTPLVERQLDDLAREHHVPRQQALEEVLLASQAVKRLIEPEEVAGVVAFLMGAGGQCITGVPVTIDQGWTAR